MLALLLVASSAFAWNHTGWYWQPEQVPLTWWMDPDPIEDSLPDDEDTQVAILQSSWDNWPQGVPCAGMDNEYQGFVYHDERSGTDTKRVMYWEDIMDEQEAGVLGVTYSSPTSEALFTENGRVYYAIEDSDIVFNNDVDFGTTEDILAGICSGESSIEAVATHEVGHLWGFAHSCEDGDPCSDDDQYNATMYWSIGPCDASKVDIGVDDIASANALYGQTGTFTAISPTSGPAPLTVQFQVESDSEVQSVRWEWGDGTEEEGGVIGTHQYTTSGSFTVKATMTLLNEECGTADYAQTEIGYVLACTEPIPEEGAKGFFQLTSEGGLIWKTVNRTDMSTYGCIDTIAWEVYEGSEVNADKLVDFNGDGAGDQIGAFAPLISFPTAGTYTVVMNIGGPGGIAGSKMTIDVVDSTPAATGCANSSTLTLAGAALAGLAAMSRRRRG